MEKETELLSRVAANHLFLAQFEPLRAALLSLHKRQPDLAVAVLRTILSSGGRLDGVLFSASCPSPAHLAWLSVLLLIEIGAAGADPDLLKLKAEFVLLLQLVICKLNSLDVHSNAVAILNKVLELGFRRLSRQVADEAMPPSEISWLADADARVLWRVFIDHGDIFDALCLNIQRQVRWSELAIGEGDEGEKRPGSAAEESEALVPIQRSVQLARLDAIRERLKEFDVKGAASHLRFLHLDYGVEELEYKIGLQDFMNVVWPQNDYYGETWHFFRKKMMLIYAEALSSDCIQLVQMIQVIQDEVLSEEFKQHKLSDANAIPLPLRRYLNTLGSKLTSTFDDERSLDMAIRSCLRDLYHFARISGTHILEIVMDTSLSSIRMERLQEASDVLSLFPLLQPLAAVLGWDLLSGKTAARRKMMQMLWTNKSQALWLEGLSVYGKHSDEISCVDYLCDLLCYHLDLAFFVACVNSGRPWNSKDSSFFTRNEKVSCDMDGGAFDPFVENFVLERLAVQTPLRVLFDVVPGIKFQDAFELINMQPAASSSSAWKRMQDIELMHMRYALESAVLALGSMECYLGDENEKQFRVAVWYLKELENHLGAITTVPRKIFMVSIVTSLLHMDEISVDWTRQVNLAAEHPDFTSPCCEGGNKMVVSFTRLLLDLLRRNLPALGSELEHMFKLKNDRTSEIRHALEWRVSNAKRLIEDWEWRLSILHHLQPLSGQPWSWKEALAIFRAAPSKLLNLCMQRAKYDIAGEAVHRFSLPPEDKATLELAEWVAGAFKRASSFQVEAAVSSVADRTPNAVLEVDFSSYCAQLGSLPAILLCIDVAATSAKSVEMCKLLLNQARGMLSEIYPGSSPKVGSAYWDQIQEFALISVTRRVLQCLHDLSEKEKAPTLKDLLIEGTDVSSSNEPTRQGQKQRALVILHQMIDDAHKGKRQFLSGKLHNLARALADEDTESNYYKGEAFSSDRKFTLSLEKGVLLGLGFKSLKQVSISSTNPGNNTELSAYDMKDSGIRFFGPLTTKPSTYLSSFIIYIATIGDIVDGVDTTHDFNFFSLIYEWPKDLLTRLVFERGSTDAAGKVADIMGADFVHEVISACVPPVLPPRYGRGWACIPVSPTFSLISSENQPSFAKASQFGSLSVTDGIPLYPLQLDIVKHLAKLSPVRAVLACVFGSSILSSDSEASSSSCLNNALVQTPDAERLFYEFALDQSERFPTLNRWIQMQSNLHRVAESVIAAKSSIEVPLTKSEAKLAVKRSRETESDTESEIDDLVVSRHSTSNLSEFSTEIHLSETWQDYRKSKNVEPDKAIYFSFDWENEGPYEKAVERLIEEGKLMDALALSDRFLRKGASDRLLQLLIERGEENNPISGQTHGYGARNLGSNSWQYCLRLKDKQLAARLALKYLRNWDLDAAMDVLTMCSCHLSQNDPIRNEVLLLRQALQKYNHILCADDRYSSWQEVEADCKEDPEGLALRLSAKGAVSAALEVAESASLSIDLRRELQGRQLVKLLTADPLSGGGPAQASRFLSTLCDSDDALPVAIGAMQMLPDLRSKQLLVHFFLKRRVANLLDADVIRLNSWALGLRVLSVLPLPSQQRCSSLHEHPHLILEVLLMMKQLQSASLILTKFPSLRDDNLILSYAAKAISVDVTSVRREPRISVSGPRAKQNAQSNMSSRSIFTQSISNLQKEARRAFSWSPREVGNQDSLKVVQRKRKNSSLMPSERVAGEAMAGIQEERVSGYSADGQERSTFLSIAEEWVLTGDPNKDNEVRSSHRYETSPDITLFKALLSLCTDESVAAKGAVELCINHMKNVLSSQHVPLHASTETLARAYHATETYVQALAHVKSLLRKLHGNIDFSSNSERSRDADDASTDTGSSTTGGQYTDELSELLAQADIWLGRAELLQSLLGSGIVASLDDIGDKDSSVCLRDRLIEDERYNMAVYTCKKCKIDGFPAWNAWGHALIRMEHYAQARVKFKQALQLHKGDHANIVMEIINTVEGGPPADVLAVRSMYEHLAKSAPTILDDSLSADAYLNVLYMPSTFPRSERSRSQEAARSNSATSNSDFEDGPRSNLDNLRYSECIYYLQEYARPQMLVFMFRHGHFSEACLLFFPPDTMPSPAQPSSHGSATPLTPQRSDPLATDYGTLDELCDLCFGYGATEVLEDVISARNASSITQDIAVKQYTAAALARICNYCETHRHFNYLYKFQVLKGDHVAAGLCCIQLFVNSSSQEQAIKHLEHAKVHFEEGLSARHRAIETTRLVSKAARGQSASEKLTEEGLVKFSARVAIQVDVVKAFNVTEGPQWKHSLFGNPNDPETFRRRCEIAETLAEKHFDLAFQVIYEFNLPAVDIYAGVAASLAERKKGSQLTEFFKNIKGTIEEDDWDQVVGAAISIYANKHKERPDRLIDMLTSSHRKVLACVVCGRLKTAFQIASRSGSVADVEYVAHQAMHVNALPVIDMCKQWLLQYK